MSGQDDNPIYKQPEPGEVWMDLNASLGIGKPRELLITGTGMDTVPAVALTGGNPGKGGVPRHYFDDGSIIFQGYWAKTHKMLPRLAPPYGGHPLSTFPKASAFAKLHGTADLVNAILPSLQPDDVESYDREFNRVHRADLSKPVSMIPAGVAYLKLGYRYSPRVADAKHAARIGALYYQKQQSAWYLVRTLVTPPEIDNQEWRIL